jgi:hypothetical protein
MDVPFGMQGLFPQPISYPPNPQQPDNEDANQESSDATTSSPQVSVILTVRLLMQGKVRRVFVNLYLFHIQIISL